MAIKEQKMKPYIKFKYNKFFKRIFLKNIFQKNTLNLHL